MFQRVYVCVCTFIDNVAQYTAFFYYFLNLSISLSVHPSFLTLHFLNPSSFSSPPLSLSKSGISQWSPLPTSPLSILPPFSSASPAPPPPPLLRWILQSVEWNWCGCRRHRQWGREAVLNRQWVRALSCFRQSQGSKRKTQEKRHIERDREHHTERQAE